MLTKGISTMKRRTAQGHYNAEWSWRYRCKHKGFTYKNPKKSHIQGPLVESQLCAGPQHLVRDSESCFQGAGQTVQWTKCSLR